MSHLILCSIVVSLLAELATAQMTGAHPQLVPDFVVPKAAPFDRLLCRSVVWDGGTLQGIEMRGRTSGKGLSSMENELSMAEFAPYRESSKRTLWSGHVFAPWRGDLSFARFARGKSVVVGTDNDGLLSGVAVWSTRGQGADTMSRDCIRELRCTGTPIGGEEPVRGRKLFDPSLIEWRGELCLVATGGGSIRADPPQYGYFVWASALTYESVREGGFVRDGLDAQFVAEGVDPRVVTVGAEVVVALREEEFSEEFRGEAPVHFYRSSDLVHWSRDEALSSGVVASSDYAIAAHSGTIWLASSAGENADLLTVCRFDAQQAAWQAAAELDRRVGTPRRRMWLVPNPSDGSLELFQFDEKGEFRRTAF